MQETRLSIRLLLLQAFGALSSLEQRVVSELLNSVLPLELARDIHNDVSGDSFQSAIQQSGIFKVSLWLIGTVLAEPGTVISRAWVQSPDPAEYIVSRLLACML